MGLKTDTGREVHRGKKKKRSEIQELLMLLLIDREGPIGRYRLKEMLNLTEREGVVRYMLHDLQNRNYVSTSRSGCTLTRKGKTLLKNRLRTYDIVDVKSFVSPIVTTAQASIGLHLQDKANKIHSAMEIRDLAIRGGAVGATIFLLIGEELTVPAVQNDFLAKHSALTQKIHESFRLKNNDVLAIISAEDEWRGLEASLQIAKVLSNSSAGSMHPTEG